jgi:hypothetical protein
MAYRNFASHPDPIINADGSIALVSGEFDYARTSGAICGIVIGQEFGEVYPQKVSFWWRGRAAFRQAAGELTQTYGSKPQFRGLSVNDLDSYEATRTTSRHRNGTASARTMLTPLPRRTESRVTPKRAISPSGGD